MEHTSMYRSNTLLGHATTSQNIYWRRFSMDGYNRTPYQKAKNMQTISVSGIVLSPKQSIDTNLRLKESIPVPETPASSEKIIPGSAAEQGTVWNFFNRLFKRKVSIGVLRSQKSVDSGFGFRKNDSNRQVRVNKSFCEASYDNSLHTFSGEIDTLPTKYPPKTSKSCDQLNDFQVADGDTCSVGRAQYTAPTKCSRVPLQNTEIQSDFKASDFSTISITESPSSAFRGKNPENLNRDPVQINIKSNDIPKPRTLDEDSTFNTSKCEKLPFKIEDPLTKFSDDAIWYLEDKENAPKFGCYPRTDLRYSVKSKKWKDDNFQKKFSSVESLDLISKTIDGLSQTGASVEPAILPLSSNSVFSSPLFVEGDVNKIRPLSISDYSHYKDVLSPSEPIKSALLETSELTPKSNSSAVDVTYSPEASTSTDNVDCLKSSEPIIISSLETSKLLLDKNFNVDNSTSVPASNPNINKNLGYELQIFSKFLLMLASKNPLYMENRKRKLQQANIKNSQSMLELSRVECAGYETCYDALSAKNYTPIDSKTDENTNELMAKCIKNHNVETVNVKSNLENASLNEQSSIYDKENKEVETAKKSILNCSGEMGFPLYLKKGKSHPSDQSTVYAANGECAAIYSAPSDEYIDKRSSENCSPITKEHFLECKSKSDRYMQLALQDKITFFFMNLRDFISKSTQTSYSKNPKIDEIYHRNENCLSSYQNDISQTTEYPGKNCSKSMGGLLEIEEQTLVPEVCRADCYESSLDARRIRENQTAEKTGHLLLDTNTNILFEQCSCFEANGKLGHNTNQHNDEDREENEEKITPQGTKSMVFANECDLGNEVINMNLMSNSEYADDTLHDTNKKNVEYDPSNSEITLLKQKSELIVKDARLATQQIGKLSEINVVDKENDRNQVIFIRAKSKEPALFNESEIDETFIQNFTPVINTRRRRDRGDSHLHESDTSIFTNCNKTIEKPQNETGKIINMKKSHSTDIRRDVSREIRIELTKRHSFSFERDFNSNCFNEEISGVQLNSTGFSSEESISTVTELNGMLTPSLSEYNSSQLTLNEYSISQKSDFTITMPSVKRHSERNMTDEYMHYEYDSADFSNDTNSVEFYNLSNARREKATKHNSTNERASNLYFALEKNMKRCSSTSVVSSQLQSQMEESGYSEGFDSESRLSAASPTAIDFQHDEESMPFEDSATSIKLNRQFSSDGSRHNAITSQTEHSFILNVQPPLIKRPNVDSKLSVCNGKDNFALLSSGLNRPGNDIANVVSRMENICTPLQSSRLTNKYPTEYNERRLIEKTRINGQILRQVNPADLDLTNERKIQRRVTSVNTLSMDDRRKSNIKRSQPVTKKPNITGALKKNSFAANSDLGPVTHKNEDPKNFLKFEKELGRGKFGRVMRCEHKTGKDIFAVKILRSRRQTRHKNGDLMEVAILWAIGFHENIASFYSAYEYLQECYIITECVDGGALYDRVVAEDNLDEKICASIVRQLLLGLQHIQACHVLHLDLKPENVMMVAPFGYKLKIIDFGLARFYDPQHPPKCLDGTFIYSAPEVINYENLSFVTDLWSVAVITYEILSGVTPFEIPQFGDPDRELTKADITTNIINCRYNFNDDGICDATESAKDFIRRLLKKNPTERPCIEECLDHGWMQTLDRLPTIKREVSLRRRHTAQGRIEMFE